MKEEIQSDRRAGGERRRRPTNPFHPRSLFGGRRKGHRREQGQSGYLDLYDYKLLMVVLSILVLCSVDAVATVLHMEEEVASEMNPLMAYLISFGPMKFFFIKYLLTSFGLIILVLHSPFPKVRFALFGVLICYGIIVTYHVFIFFNYW